MATLIEIISVRDSKLTAAFYVDIPVGDQLAKAKDAGRDPAGSKLTTEEVAALRDGSLQEIVKTFDIGSAQTLSDIQSTLEAAHASLVEVAKAKYKESHRLKGFVGNYFRDNTWS